MTVAPHPAAHRRSPSPPAARRNTSATPARGRQSSCDRGQRLAPAHRRHRKRPPPPLPPKTPSAARPPTPRSPAVRDPQIPIGALAKRSPYLPAVSSLGGFRAPAPAHAQPSQRAGARNPSPKRAFPSPRQRQECPRKRPKALREPCARSGRSLDDDSGAEDFSDPVRVESNRARSFGRAARDGARSTAPARLRPPEARGPSRSPSAARPGGRL